MGFKILIYPFNSSQTSASMFPKNGILSTIISDIFILTIKIERYPDIFLVMLRLSKPPHLSLTTSQCDFYLTSAFIYPYGFKNNPQVKLNQVITKCLGAGINA